MNLQEVKTHLKRMIEKSMDAGLQAFDENIHADSPLRNDLSIYQRNCNDVKWKYHQSILTYAEYMTQSGKITAGLLFLVEQVTVRDLPDNENSLGILGDESHPGPGDTGTLTGTMVDNQKIEIEITLDGDYDNFSPSDQKQVIKAIEEFLRMEQGTIKIKKKERGSIKLTFELTREQALKLEAALEDGMLSELGITAVARKQSGTGIRVRAEQTLTDQPGKAVEKTESLDNFRIEILRELEPLSKEEIISFSWRCAIRALPFLGLVGHFDFWSKPERQVYLYGVFHALEVRMIPKGSERVYAAVRAAADARAAATTAATATRAAATTAAYAAVANAAAIAAAIAAYAVYAATKALPHVLGFQEMRNLIKIDLMDIKANRQPQISTEAYGIIWDNFQLALKREGCAYWAQWFEGIFQNNFQFDQEEVRMRLEVPEDIKAKGAAAVGKYMLEKLGREE